MSSGADLGLRYFADPTDDLVSTRIGVEKLWFVVPADHPLKQNRLRTLDKLRGAQWLGFPPERNQPESAGHLVARAAAAAGQAFLRVLPKSLRELSSRL